ncbi:hypothetical protein BH11MYX4_BH11MYX4_62640 [soil metagenome]
MLVTFPALAAPTAAQRETARRLMDEGKERMRAGEKERALEAYRKAHDLMKVPSTGIAVAKAHLALGHLIEARDVALEVVRMPRDSGEPPVFEKARKEAKELEASLKPRIPTVRIVVKGGPATRVSVDEGEVAPLLLGEPVAVNPGRHSVSARNADGAEKRADVELAERDAKQVELVLPVPSPAVVQAVLPPQPGARPAPAVTTEGTTRTTGASVLVFGGFGLAAAGLAVGGISGALTLSKAGAVKEQCANDVCDPAAKADLDSAGTLATISTVGFAVAGGGLVLGVVGLLLPRTKVESALHSTEQRAAVWVGPGGAGLRGSF